MRGHPRIFLANVAVLLVGAVDDAHAVDQEVGHVEHAALVQREVVPLQILELVVGGAADDAGRKPRDGARPEHAARRARSEDVGRLLEDPEVVAA